MRRIIADAKKSLMLSAASRAKMQKVADSALEAVKKEAANHDGIVGVELGGSFAKDTWVKKGADLDIFIKFKRTVPAKEFTRVSQKIGFDSMKNHSPHTRYSEHPFVEAEIQKTRINIVPCYDVRKKRWQSSADRSPHHTKVMQERLTPKMRGDVRLLKAFLAAAGIYGAEIARRGFSGYVSEVLVLECGSFENVVKKMACLQEGMKIGTTRRRFNTMVVIVDPVDSNRNLAAAISRENIGKFILRCRAFQKNPSTKFFKPGRPARRGKTESNEKNTLVVKFKFSKRSPEIIWGQINRASSSLATQLRMNGFNVLRSRPYTDEKKYAYMMFFLESVKISETFVNQGPEYLQDVYTWHFIRKNIPKSKLMWIGEERVYSVERRQTTDAKACLKNLIKDNRRAGLPKGLRDDFRRGFRVFSGAEKLDGPAKDAMRDMISTDGAFFHFN